MSDSKAVPDLIMTIFREELQVEVPSADADLLQGGYLDSLALVDLLLRLEERFGISIDLGDVDIEEFESVEQIAALVERQQAEQLAG